MTKEDADIKERLIEERQIEIGLYMLESVLWVCMCIIILILILMSIARWRRNARK